MKYSVILAIVLVVSGLLIGGWYLYTQQISISQIQPSPSPSETTTPSPGPITIQGHIVCLPHRNTDGPQTMECAFGLKDATGRYYGLRDSDPMYRNISGIPTNTEVEIQGSFTPQADIKYQSIGVINVTKITETSPSTSPSP